VLSSATYGQRCVRSRVRREAVPWCAFSNVVAKYSSRSRLNFSCVALKLATRAAISARSRASLSSLSVIQHALLFLIRARFHWSSEIEARMG
jgi:hypothetical protein